VPLAREEGLREITAFAAALHGPRPDLLVRIEAALARLAEARGVPALAGLRPTTRLIPDDPWEDLWRARWRPFRVAGFLLRPPWRPAPPKPEDQEVVLDPGSAFGTGLHPTTRQALRGLRRWLDRIGPTAGSAEICDAGTGSAILAIAALRAGVGRATAFDLDERAAAIARRNAEACGVADRLALYCGGPESLAACFPLVLANLETDIHLENAGPLAALVGPGGTLVATGIHAARAGGVLGAYAAEGLEGRTVGVRGKWAALELGRPT